MLVPFRTFYTFLDIFWAAPLKVYFNLNEAEKGQETALERPKTPIHLHNTNVGALSNLLPKENTPYPSD